MKRRSGGKNQISSLGQSLFEVILTVAIITLIITGVVSLAVNSLQNAVYSRNKTRSSRYVQEAVEWLRRERDTDFTLFKSRSETPVWCLNSLSWNNLGTCGADEKISGTPFKRELNFITSLKSGKIIIEASVVVSWEDSRGLHEVKSITYFTDWREK